MDKVREGLEAAAAKMNKNELLQELKNYLGTIEHSYTYTNSLIRKFIRYLEEQGNWQDISTAPKDGSIIVAYNPLSHSDNKYETALWSDGAWRPRKETTITFPSLTHWQPLPNPPKKIGE